MKKFRMILILAILSVFTVNCPKEKPKDEGSSGLIYLLIGTTAGTGTGTTTGTSTGTSTVTASISTSAVSAVSGQTISVTVTASGAFTDSIMLSSNNLISAADTTAASAQSFNSGTNTVTISIPSSLVSSSATSPVPYYIGLLSNGSVSTSQVMVFPSDSTVTAYTFNTQLTSQTITSSVTKIFYEVDVVNGVNFVMSAYHVSGGLDPIMNLHTLSGNLTAVDSRSSNNYERSGVNVTATQKAWLQVRRYGSTTGTFSFFAANSSISSASTIATGGGSCTGGTSLTNGKCVDYDTNYTTKPTNSTDCVTAWGTGSDLPSK